MNILEAIARVREMPETAVLVGRPPLFTASEAAFAELNESHELPVSWTDAGFEYILGKEGIENVLEWCESKKMSDGAKAELVIHYAVFDAVPAWFYDLPDN